MAKRFAASLRAVDYVAGKERIAAALLELVEPGDIVIALGAGDINASARELLALIETAMKDRRGP